MENIIAADDLRADLYRGAGKHVVYTFTERTYRNLDGQGFGTSFLLKNGFDVIAIKSSRDVWYENLTSAQLAQLAAAGAAYKTRSTYGSSMGGYAAIRFAADLSADRALAISPLFDIKKKWEKRWLADLPQMSDAPMLAAEHIGDCDYFIVSDPRSKDARHVALFRELVPQMHVLEVPYAGHPAGPYLREIGALQIVALSVLRDGRFPSMQFYRGKRRTSAAYLSGLAGAALRKKRYELAKRLNAMARQLQPNDASLYVQRANIFKAIGNLKGAALSLDQALKLRPQNTQLAKLRAELPSGS